MRRIISQIWLACAIAVFFSGYLSPHNAARTFLFMLIVWCIVQLGWRGGTTKL